IDDANSEDSHRIELRNQTNHLIEVAERIVAEKVEEARVAEKAVDEKTSIELNSTIFAQDECKQNFDGLEREVISNGLVEVAQQSSDEKKYDHEIDPLTIINEAQQLLFEGKLAEAKAKLEIVKTKSLDEDTQNKYQAVFNDIEEIVKSLKVLTPHVSELHRISEENNAMIEECKPTTQQVTLLGHDTDCNEQGML
ncbi:MAG: hypothetical protein SFT68_05100, partial [Rickettsiaceae bacterium]|nr:hypothetical protein [Rickettsiaceae bacterium]